MKSPAMKLHRHAKALVPTLLLVAGIGGSTFWAVTGTATAQQPAAAVVIGSPAPAFELNDQDGKLVNLNDYRDKVVVLEWFNNECPFVQKHYKTGAMNATAKKYAEKGVVWLAVNSTRSHNVSHNKQIAGQWSMERPILDDSNGTIGHLYGAKTTPHMYVINKGTLVYAGAIDSKSTDSSDDIASSTNYVAQALDEVLADKPVTTAQTKPYGCSVKYKS